MTVRRAAASLLLLALAAVSALAADEPAPDLVITSSIDRTAVTVGDVIRYTLTVEWAPGLDVTPPPLAINLGQFELRDYHPGEPVKLPGGRTRLSTTYEIAVYEAGAFTIPGVPIAYKDAAGNARTADSEPLDLQVESVAPDMAGSIRDIRGPVEIPVDWRPYAIASALALAAIATAAFGYLAYRRWKARRLRRALARPHEPPHEWALAALDRLLAAGHLEAGRIMEYYVGITEIFRGYLKRRFALPALERTTTEILDEARSISIPEPLCETIEGFLAAGDRVKFARHTPDADEPARMLETAREFVRATRPVPEAPAAASEGAAA